MRHGACSRPARPSLYGRTGSRPACPSNRDRGCPRSSRPAERSGRDLGYSSNLGYSSMAICSCSRGQPRWLTWPACVTTWAPSPARWVCRSPHGRSRACASSSARRRSSRRGRAASRDPWWRWPRGGRTGAPGNACSWSARARRLLAGCWPRSAISWSGLPCWPRRSSMRRRPWSPSPTGARSAACRRARGRSAAGRLTCCSSMKRLSSAMTSCSALRSRRRRHAGRVGVERVGGQRRVLRCGGPR